jgi:hypothetical protein
MFFRHRHSGYSDFENITKMILDDIVKAGSLHFNGKLSILGPIVNLNTATKHFTQALRTVFTNNKFSADNYKKLSELEKENIRAKVVQHFVEKYSDKSNVYRLLHLKRHHYTKYFEGIYLLGSIFGVRLNASDENIKKTLVREINLSLGNSIPDLQHKERILTLAIAYRHRDSFFSQLPSELINHIGYATNILHFQHKK